MHACGWSCSEASGAAWKLIHEDLKHLTTLATATAVVELALYREQLVEAFFLASSLFLLSVCVVFCLFRMASVADNIESGNSPKNAWPAAGLYIGGLLTFALFALGLPWWVMTILGAIGVVVGFVLMRFGR